MIAAAVLFLRAHWRPLILFAVLAMAILALFAWREQAREAGRDEVRDQNAVAAARAAERAAAGRETAATERHLDNAGAAARLEDRNRETDRLPDRAPDPRAYPRRCRQLREAGHDVGALPECRGSEG